MASIAGSVTHSTSNSRTSKYRPEIDGLRAFAVVAVIINHFNKDLLPSGYLGVDIFFVISGYVITSSLANRNSKNFQEFLTAFYGRRTKRLVPALVVFIVITSILITLFNPDPNAAIKTGISALFGLSNLYLLKQSTNYFAQSTELNPFAHTWSLGVEEQFYFLYPFLIWFSGFGQQKPGGERRLLAWVGAITIASLTGFIYLYETNQPAAYFLLMPRFWEIAAGCLVFVAFQSRSRLKKSLDQIPPSLVVVSMVAIMVLPTTLAVPNTIGIVVLTSLLIACLNKEMLTYKFYTNKAVLYVGQISYSLYLWHWTVLSISRWTTGIYWWSVPIQIALMTSLSIASYSLIEKPFRKDLPWSKLGLATRMALVYATATVSLIGLSAYKRSIIAIGDTLMNINPIKDTGILQEQIYCHLPRRSSTAISDCLGKAKQGIRSIYIIGDSHASNHYPSIKKAVSELQEQARVKVLIDWGFINWLNGIEGCGSNSPCINSSGEKHMNFFETYLNNGDIIVFSWWRQRVNIPQNHLPRIPNKKRIKILENQLTTIAGIAIKSKAKIVLADDIPITCIPGTNYKHFILRLKQFEKCSVQESISLEDRLGLTLLYRKLTDLHPDVFLYFDPHSSLCKNSQCGIFDRRQEGNNRLLYGDEIGHFRPEYSDPLAITWRDYLKTIFRVKH